MPVQQRRPLRGLQHATEQRLGDDAAVAQAAGEEPDADAQMLGETPQEH